MGKFTATYTYNLDFIRNTESEDYWYIAGMLAADGYISDSEIELCLATIDKHIIEDIRDIMCFDKPIYTRKNQGTGAFMLKLNNVEMVKHFKQLFSMETNKKHEELIFPRVPDKYLKDFVRGYFDGDGGIDSTKAYQTVNGEKKVYIGPRIRILGNQKFLTSLLDEVRKQVPNKTFAVSKKGKENVYYITYNFSTAKEFLKWMYKDSPNLFLNRKRERSIEVCT